MSADYPSELESQIAVRMKNSTLNEVVKQAVKEGLSVEEWILRAVEEKLKNRQSIDNMRHIDNIV
jgi:predicted HicB family RNase H-like nuclease